VWAYIHVHACMCAWIRCCRLPAPSPWCSHVLPPHLPLLPPSLHILRFRISIFPHLAAHLLTLFAPLAARPLFLPTYLLARLHAHLDAQLDDPPPQPAHPPRNLLAQNHTPPSPTSFTGRDGRRHGGTGRRACGHGYLYYGVRTVLRA